MRVVGPGLFSSALPKARRCAPGDGDFEGTRRRSPPPPPLAAPPTRALLLLGGDRLGALPLRSPPPTTGGGSGVPRRSDAWKYCFAVDASRNAIDAATAVAAAETGWGDRARPAAAAAALPSPRLLDGGTRGEPPGLRLLLLLLLLRLLLLPVFTPPLEAAGEDEGKGIDPGGDVALCRCCCCCCCS